MLILLSSFFAFKIFCRLDGGTTVLDKYASSEKILILLKQTYNGNIGEPYTVDFFYKTNGDYWKWFYLGHEEERWLSGKLLEENGKIYIIKNFTRVAEFDPTEESFLLYSLKRKTVGAQKVFPKDVNIETTNSTLQ